MESSKLKVGATAVALAIGCAGLSYVVYYKYKNRPKDAVHLYQNIIIETVNTVEKCDVVISELRKRSAAHKAVGFDCEWVSDQGKRHPVALVQLSSLDGLCGLFRLNQLKEIPRSLKDLLEDENIYKVGVGPLDDAKYLRNDYGVDIRSTLDIRFLAQLCGHNPGGLANLSKTLLNCILDKSWRIRCSDWEAEVLTERQANYAAMDAYVAINIFIKLINEFNNPSFFKWFSKNNNLLDNISEISSKYADSGFKWKNRPATEPGSKASKPSKSRPARENGRHSYSARTKPMYHNCNLQAPDGELLCTCDQKKAAWYIQKELADLISEDPMTVRLRFEPAGRSVGEVGRYYQLAKENKCVVCGATNSYIRKNVVPREYRRCFPDIIKDNSSHDVVLLCFQCHQKSNMCDQAVRVYLAKLCKAPVDDRSDPKYFEDADGKKIKSAARTLLYQSKIHDIPEARRKELEDKVKAYYNVEELTEELLKDAAEKQVTFENIAFESYGLKVVEYFSRQEGGVLKLEELWREHFLNSMKPKFMPELWSVKHSEERLRVRWDEGRLSEDELKVLGLSKWL